MLKVALIGSDSTHVDMYAKLLNSTTYYPNACAFSIWGEDYAEATKKALTYDIPVVSDKIEGAIENSEIIIICNRYGEDHYIPAKLAMELKKPTFVDKPFTIDTLEAKELFALSKIHDVPLLSFSPIRFSDEVIDFDSSITTFGSIKGIVITCPANSLMIKDIRSKNIYFYGIHGVDLMFSIMKAEIVDLTVNSSKIGIWVSIKFDSGQYCTINFPYNVSEKYSLLVLGSRLHRLYQVKSIQKCFENSLTRILKHLDTEERNDNYLVESIKAIELLDSINKKVNYEG